MEAETEALPFIVLVDAEHVIDPGSPEPLSHKATSLARSHLVSLILGKIVHDKTSARVIWIRVSRNIKSLRTYRST